MTLGVILGVALTCGFIAGAIGYSKADSNSAFVVFFILGTMFPVIGIVLAALSKPVAKPGGWYQDPWNPQTMRWHDGQQWTAVQR